MNTSYFSNLRNIKHPLSIALYPPIWYNGACFKSLAPTSDTLQKYKKGLLTPYTYTEEYTKTVLAKLDPVELYTKLVAAYTEDVTLLCYEKPSDFCHRRLVAEWFQSALNIEVPELRK